MLFMPTKRTLSGGFRSVPECAHMHTRGGAAPAAVSHQNLLVFTLQEVDWEVRHRNRVTNSGNIWSFGHQKSAQAKKASSTSVKENSWGCTEASRGGKNRIDVEQGGKMESCFGCSPFGRFLQIAGQKRLRARDPNNKEACDSSSSSQPVVKLSKQQHDAARWLITPVITYNHTTQSSCSLEAN